MILRDGIGNYIQLEIGMRIRVRFGSRGTRSARVQNITRRGNAYITTYNKSRKKWSCPRRLWAAEFIGVECYNPNSSKLDMV